MMDNREYILRHRGEDVRVLALRGAEAGVDVPYCLCQIEAWQKARVKLPRWAATDGILFP
ncbi:MAG TPA: SAM-dependent methyltransferase, partial [Prevotellaceae bacterium]|nr:SAM-dependent methyltransferase [Prevotellaceae bacterium]